MVVVDPNCDYQMTVEEGKNQYPFYRVDPEQKDAVGQFSFVVVAAVEHYIDLEVEVANVEVDLIYSVEVVACHTVVVADHL